ncbi:MAG: DUF2497 domain-containing protein [Pseudomonadota bacterium]
MSENSNPADLTLEDILATIRRMQRGDGPVQGAAPNAQLSAADGAVAQAPTAGGTAPAASRAADPTAYAAPLAATPAGPAAPGVPPLTADLPAAAPVAARVTRAEIPSAPLRASQDARGDTIDRPEDDTRRLAALAAAGTLPPPPAAASPLITPLAVPSSASPAAPLAAPGSGLSVPETPPAAPAPDGFAQFGFEEPELPAGDGLSLETDFNTSGPLAAAPPAVPQPAPLPLSGSASGDAAAVSSRSDGRVADALVADGPVSGDRVSDGLTSFAAFAPQLDGPAPVPSPADTLAAAQPDADNARTEPGLNALNRDALNGDAPTLAAPSQPPVPDAPAAPARSPSAFARFFSPNRSADKSSGATPTKTPADAPALQTVADEPVSSDPSLGAVSAAVTDPGAPGGAARIAQAPEERAGAAQREPVLSAPAAASPARDDALVLGPEAADGTLDDSLAETLVAAGSDPTGDASREDDSSVEASNEGGSLGDAAASAYDVPAEPRAAQPADDTVGLAEAAEGIDSAAPTSAPAVGLPNVAALPVGDIGKQSFDDAIVTLLKPMLRTWLDENMPRLVVQATQELQADTATAAPAHEADDTPEAPEAGKLNRLNGLDRSST